ncbi:MAG: hypothetical protein PGN25_13080 [Methylorubrum populi]
MTTLTITLESHVMAQLQTLADERRASVHDLAVEAIESIVRRQTDKARGRLLDLIDASRGEIGPVTWKRDDLHDR